MDLHKILEVVSLETNTNLSDLMSASRKRKIVEARFLFFFFSIYLTDKSCNEIGGFLNRRHNTALHGVRKAVELKKYHKDFLKKFTNVNEKLNLNT